MTEKLPGHIAETLVTHAAYASEGLFDAYRWMRANNPLGVAEVEGFDPFWAVTKHADILEISRNNARFPSAVRATTLTTKSGDARAHAITGTPHLVRSLVQMDEPDHMKYRLLTQAWFMPQSIKKREEEIRTLAKEAVAGFVALPGPFMAGSDRLRIIVTGSQTHGAQPHRGVDPIVVSSQIVTALQTIPARQMDAVRSPVIVTIGSIHGGVRYNIIPDRVEMEGTVRYLNPGTREDLYNRIRRTATEIAESAGARAEVSIEPNAIPVVNPAEPTARARAALVRALGEDNVLTDQPNMVAEDFAYFQQRVPGVFFFYGIRPPGVELADAAPNHSPRFFVHEPAMETALRAMVAVALDRVGAGG